jgi:ABC-type multidrug transport system fused ATPase/permease subunit
VARYGLRRHSRTLEGVAPAKPITAERLRDLWPSIWELIRPRRVALAIGFVLIVIRTLAGMVLPMSTKYLIDDVVGKHNYGLLKPLVLAAACASILQASASFTLTQILSKAAQRLIAELRRKVQSHIGRLPVSFYDTNKTGMLVSRIMSDVEGVRNLLGTGLVELAGGLLTASLALVVLLRISVSMTLVALVLISIFALFLRRALKSIRPIFRERGKINAEVTGRLTETLSGVRVVKGYHAEAREEQVFAQGVQRLLDNVLRSLTGMSLMSLSGTLLTGLIGASIMFLGARQILAGTLTLGDFVRFTAFLAFLVAPVAQIVSIGTQLTEAIAGLERTREVMRERQEDEDPGRTAVLPEMQGTVEFDEVSFAYEAGKTVLHEVSFVTRPGTVTALVGSSGSGKSTIIGLIAGFYKAQSGRVLVDGVDLSAVKLSSYRTHLGVVLQESFLFDGSIRENVAFGRPDATDEQVREACRIARVDEFAESFEKGYDTIVGERGVKLSGGQRQRVSIARAILADPRILILDEATSSLDSESESLIQQGLAYLMRGRTTFVIAHRLSTIRRADQILVVEDGRVIERGTHESLYALGGRYYDLYTRQHGLEANLFLAPGEGDSVVTEDEGSSEAKRRGDDLPDPIKLIRG